MRKPQKSEAHVGVERTFSNHRVELCDHGEVHPPHIPPALDRVEIVRSLRRRDAALEHGGLQAARVHFREWLPLGDGEVVGDLVVLAKVELVVCSADEVAVVVVLHEVALAVAVHPSI